MIIRQESSQDEEVVRSIVAAAFANEDGEEPVEARLLDGLRECDGWIPAMSIVATRGDEIVGHALCTRGYVTAPNVDDVSCVGLGPIAVVPELQRAGIGLALMHTMLGISEGAGEPLVALLGSPDYYSRYGFVASASVGVQPPEEAWGEFFQVRTLSAHNPSITGTFRYAEPFQTL